MAKVDADPEVLRRFAKLMRKAEQQVTEQLRQLTRELASLDWNDDQARRFDGELRQTVKQIERFAANITSNYAPSLEKMARALDEYRKK